MTSGCGGGAGHGGYGGGSNNGTFGGIAYGSTFMPLNLGSKGGNGGSQGKAENGEIRRFRNSVVRTFTYSDKPLWLFENTIST